VETPQGELASKLQSDHQLGEIDDDEAELAYLMRKKMGSAERAPITGKTKAPLASLQF
jgi:hypothetical protein